MDGLARAEFECKLSLHLQAAEALICALANAKDRKLALQLACNSWGLVGFCAGHLGRLDSSRDAFGKSATLANQLLQLDATPWQFRNALELALVSGNRDAETQVLLSSAPTEHQDFSPLASCHLRAMLALLRGDRTAALTAADEAIRLDDTAGKWKLLGGIGPVLREIVGGSSETLSAGLENLLDNHIALATRGSLKGADAGLLCIPACCMGVIALRSGLSVSIDAKYHAVKLPRVVSSLDSWDGQPVLRKRFDTIVDILPREFLAQA